MRKRVRASAVTVATVGLLLVGCTATPEPSRSTTDAGVAPSASATPHPTVSTPPAPPALEIPDPTVDEIARAVLSTTGGTPTASSIVSDVPDAGVTYAVEGDCRSETGSGGVSVEWAITRADESADLIAAGEIPCDGSGSLMTLELLEAGPVQLAFTKTDGASAAWVRLTP